MKLLVFALIPLILSIGIVPTISFGELIDSPRKQMQNGIDAKDVVCKSGFVLMIRTSGNAACVKPTTAERLSAAGWGIIEKETTKTLLSPQDAQRIAEQAFIYAYPMLENYKVMYVNSVDKSSPAYVAPFNILINEKQLYTPQNTDVVSPNSDTLYSRGWNDLRTEPLVLSINPVEDRYFSFQLIDYYSHNYEYIGTRTTGNDGGVFLIAGPNWNGETPNGIDDIFQSESEINLLAGRTQVFNDDDLENAIAIMEGYKLQPLSEFLGESSPPTSSDIDFIPWSNDAINSAEFINYLNLILTWTEIHPSEKELFEEFSKIGITPGEHIVLETIDPEIINAIELGVDSALEKIDQNTSNLGEFENGWMKLVGFGDREFHGDDYLRRASADMFALYGNTIEEAFYPSGFVDKDNNILDASKNNYVIKFSEEPPVDAFWSVTMYDGDTFLMVENALDRWKIGSTSDLQKNEDGSFEIYLQHESPGDEKESNWLPSPDGKFYMLLRLYLPSESILDGTWEMPIIEKEFRSDSEIVEIVLTAEETQRITEEAFIYAYPMLENYKTMYNAAIDESSELYVASFNQLHHNEGLSTPQDSWVTTPNSDTIYTRAWLDLSIEPVIIIIPEIEQDRYYTFQLIDYYSNNFGYIGTRTTGNDGGVFLIAGPNWNGIIPDEITENHQAETEYVTILARTQVKNQDDVSNALEIMKKYELKTFSEYMGKPSPESTSKASFIPWNAEKAYGSEFVNYLNLILTWTEIHSSEKQMFEDFSKIGINTGKNVEFAESEKIIMDEAISSAMQKIEEGIFVLGTFENGWIVLDGFGDREFHETNYLKRSVAALYGLYGNTLEEALYPAGLLDAEKNILDGSKSNYQIKFSEEPPVDAFWSLTMYDQENRLLVENSIDRWLVNSLTDLEKNEDGSFVIYVQHDAPSEDKQSNWLPAPDGPIYMILRLYVPDDTIIDRTWELPIIEKIE